MKIELKNIKVAAFASVETHCYQASLYVDGKKIGDVSNEGHGGADMFHGDREAYAAASAWLKANVPPTTFATGHGDDIIIECDIEIRCCELVNDHLTTKAMQRALKTQVLFVTPEKEGIRTFKHGGKVNQYIAHVRTKYPTALILNTMPVAEALTVWRKAAE